jgi:hypothetical protein
MTDAEWLQFIFGRQVADHHNPEAERLANEVSPHDALRLVTQIFSEPDTLLTRFSDEQIAHGLTFLCAAGESDWMYHLYELMVDRQLRFDCIRSIETLYRRCFARRCRESASHLCSDGPPLNNVCYMWWDRFPGGGGPSTTNSELAAIEYELIAVMARTLQIQHVACQESALHGLGHYGGARADSVIDSWMAAHPQSPLYAYAKAARDGNVI